ncbi:hypothetical protein E4T45_05783, partial [Aureobasidium sp. EXF-8846]
PFRGHSDRSASPSVKPCYVDSRRRNDRSASPKKDLRSVSPRSVRPICAEIPSSIGTYSYAHYHTGTVAEPPISYNGKAMGGNRAKNMICNISQREEELDIRGAEIDEAGRRVGFAQADVREQTNSLIAREEYMQQREKAVQRREQSVLQCEQALQQREHTSQQREQSQQHKHFEQRERGLSEREQAVTAREHASHEREQAFAVFEEGMLRQLEGNYDGVASTVSQMRRAVGNAQGILANRRQQVLYHENFPHVAQGTLGPGRYAGSIAIDGAIGALGGLDQMLAEGEIALLAQVHNALRPQHPH